MTNVYDMKTGNKLTTIPYGNNGKRKQYLANFHNKDYEDLKKAQRDYNKLMSYIVDSMAFSTDHEHIKKLADSVKDKNTFVLSDFRGDK